MKQYHGPGPIKQIPATKQWFLRKGERAQSFMRGSIYRSVNKNGGRKIPANTIGAAYRHTNANGPDWERGINGNDDVRVRLSISDGRVTLSPEIDNV